MRRAIGGDMYKAAANMQRRCTENTKSLKGGGRCLRNNVSDADAAPLEGGCSRATGLKA